MSTFSSAFDRTAADTATAAGLTVSALTARIVGWFKAAPVTDPVEDFINANGGVISDSTERMIEQHFFHR